jgi:hypothetical protein
MVKKRMNKKREKRKQLASLIVPLGKKKNIFSTSHIGP